MKDVLKGLTVIEFANVLAGPAVGMFFAELGAKVIKVENKTTGGDLTRHWKLPGENPLSPVSSYYAAVNFGKEILMLDLNDPSGRKKAGELIQGADMVITNFRKAEAVKFSMRYADLKALNGKIIHGNISAYGEEDSRAGFDLVLQAEAGFMSMNGTAGSGPLKMPVALIDVLAAHQMKEALLLSLIRKMASGQGSFVSVSLYETAISSLVNQASNYLGTGFVPGLNGSLHPNIAPYGEVVVSSDGKSIVLAIGNDKQFSALCGIFELPDTAANTAYSSNASRLKNRILLGKKLAQAALRLDSESLLAKFDVAGIPAGSILSLDEVFAKPQAQKMILEELREGQLLRCVSSLAFKMEP